MSRIISALILTVAAATAFATEPLKLADNAPERHVVVKGDTLWGISGKFLQEPWRWPEIWRLNKDQIRNPHLIYPGDIVLLDYVDGQPRLRLGKPLKVEPKIYSEAIGREIPSIPPNVIEPFISQPLVVGADEMENAPRIIAAQDDRVVLGNGDKAFVIGMTDFQEKWQLYRPGTPLKDPVSGEVLGYEAFYLGSAQLLQPGETSIIELLAVKEEVTRGDRLVPASPPTLNAYLPHKPDQDVSALIMSIYGGVNEGGKYSVISLNKGSQDGLEPGHVLALHRKRNATYKNGSGRNETIALPEERYGLVFVFRTFDRVAYALTLDTSRPLIVGDALKNP